MGEMDGSCNSILTIRDDVGEKSEEGDNMAID